MAESETSGQSVDTVVPDTDDTSLGMSLAIKSMRAKFPAVLNVATKTVHQWMVKQKAGSTEDRVILLDARPEEEFAVSHLPDAVRVDPQASDEDVNKAVGMVMDSLPKNSDNVHVVCYCSIGYRSSKYADALSKAIKKGQENPPSNLSIYNLEGCIFKWANEARPMIDHRNQSTNVAHPYNAVFGKVLNSNLRAWKPVQSADTQVD